VRVKATVATEPQLPIYHGSTPTIGERPSLGATENAQRSTKQKINFTQNCKSSKGKTENGRSTLQTETRIYIPLTSVPREILLPANRNAATKDNGRASAHTLVLNSRRAAFYSVNKRELPFLYKPTAISNTGIV